MRVTPSTRSHSSYQMAKSIAASAVSSRAGVGPSRAAAARSDADESGADSPLLKNLFQQEAVKRGVLFLATHNMTAAHDADAVDVNRTRIASAPFMSPSIPNGTRPQP